MEKGNRNKKRKKKGSSKTQTSKWEWEKRKREEADRRPGTTRVPCCAKRYRANGQARGGPEAPRARRQAPRGLACNFSRTGREVRWAGNATSKGAPQGYAAL